MVFHTAHERFIALARGGKVVYRMPQGWIVVFGMGGVIRSVGTMWQGSGCVKPPISHPPPLALIIDHWGMQNGLLTIRCDQHNRMVDRACVLSNMVGLGKNKYAEGLKCKWSQVKY